jgi:cytochrome P450
MKPFTAIPLIQARASGARTLQDQPFNPWEIPGLVHKQLDSKIYRMVVHTPNEGAIESVWISDEDEARRVLANTEGIWRKGPQTFEPFSSLVPKHLISLEGEEHALVRAAAQTALSDCIVDGLIPRQAALVGSKLVGKLRDCLIKQQPCWFAVKEGDMAVCTQVDKMFRGAALDIVSFAVFGESWNALDDYSPTNPMADALAKVMHELHWRVVDMTNREWRRTPSMEPAGSLLNKLDAFIESQIDSALQRGTSRTAETCMLDVWVRNPNLSRELVRNCLTFLTMGHENVASGMAWTLLCLAHNQPAQDVVASSGKKEDLDVAFHEAVRLFPSVAGLTRMNMVKTSLCGYEIPRMTEVAVGTYEMHRLETRWGANANEFAPSRCPAVSTQGPPDAFPFGVGARSCIGRPLSMVELHALVGALVREFRVVLLSDMPKPTNFVSLRPGPHKVGFMPRHQGRL